MSQRNILPWVPEFFFLACDWMVRYEPAREYFSREGHYRQGHAPKETTECFKYVRSLSNGFLHAF